MVVVGSEVEGFVFKLEYVCMSEINLCLAEQKVIGDKFGEQSGGVYALGIF